jgi:acetolactate synthase-1/3 small subunit
MSPLNIKKGSSSHSSCDRRDPNGPVAETRMLAALIQS